MSQEIDAEALVRQIEETGSAEGESQQEAPEIEATQESTEPKGFSFKSMDELLKHQLPYKVEGGKEVQEDLQTILKRASQGYHYAQRMNQLNTSEKEWQEKVQQAQAMQEKWSKFDEYARQNPDWYNHWENAWQNRNNPVGDASNDMEGQPDSRLQALLDEKLKPVQEFIQSQEQVKAQQALQQEDRELEDQIQKVRKEYNDIDFDRTNPENGKSLEYEVLEFGIQNGIKDFNVAFKAYYHDKLVERSLQRAEEEKAKKLQDQNRNGIIGQRSTPGKSAAPSLKGRSWEDVNRLAAQELGIEL